jgi:hypothetical protein
MLDRSERKGLHERDKVRDFLQLVKETIANPVGEHGWVLVRRAENNECMVQLGFKYADVEETLLGLSVEDYCEGPCRDRDQPGELWVFGKEIEGRTIYIKLKLASFGTVGSLRIVRIVSFHVAEYALEHPFQEKGGDGDEEDA